MFELLCVMIATLPALLRLLFDVVRYLREQKAKVNEEKPP
jgi:hypothetical protein